MCFNVNTLNSMNLITKSINQKSNIETIIVTIVYTNALNHLTRE